MVCARNKWNPYDAEICKIPMQYWLLSYNFIEMNDHYKWSNELEPQAELIGYISNPEVYSEYKKVQKAQKEGKEAVFESGGSKTTLASADVHFEPGKGMVDSKGVVVISLKTLQETNAMVDGMFLST